MGGAQNKTMVKNDMFSPNANPPTRTLMVLLSCEQCRSAVVIMSSKGTAFVSPVTTGAQPGSVLHFGRAAVRPRPARRVSSLYDSTSLLTIWSSHGEVPVAQEGDISAQEDRGSRPAQELAAGGVAAAPADAKNGEKGNVVAVPEATSGGYNARVHARRSSPNSNMRKQGANQRHKKEAAPSPHEPLGVVRRVVGAREASAAAGGPVYGSPLELEASAEQEGVSVAALVRSRAFVKRIRGMRKFGSWEKALEELDQAEREELRFRQQEEENSAGSESGGVLER